MSSSSVRRRLSVRAALFILTASPSSLSFGSVSVGFEDPYVPSREKQIVDRLAAVSMDSLQQPEFHERLRTLGFEVIGKGPDAMRRRIADEVPRYRDLIAKAGIERV